MSAHQGVQKPRFKAGVTPAFPHPLPLKKKVKAAVVAIVIAASSVIASQNHQPKVVQVIEQFISQR